NPDLETTIVVVQGLAARKEQFKRPYCPCRLMNPDSDNRDIICPCDYMEQEIAEDGECHCKLFMSPEHANEVRKELEKVEM
ncbi:MAG: ferredoxin-thioredoxin reductase catalytic domain-containing protein, partial [Methermicoccaceae archaeon]